MTLLPPNLSYITVVQEARKRPYLAPAIAIGATTAVFGVSFGVLAVSAGLTVLQTCAMSLLVFTGASQFAAVGVIAAGGLPLAAVGSGLLVGLRNAGYGFAMSRVLPRSLLPRALATQLVIDESTALALAYEDDPRGAFLAGGLSVFALWNLGTLAGALAGTGIGDPETFGIDAAFPASLLALVAPRLRDATTLRTALLGAAIALALTPLLSPGLPIILASAAVLPFLRERPS